MTVLRNVHVTDPVTGDQQGVDPLGHADVIQHAHAEGGQIHFVSGSLTTGTYDFIVVDLSDTTNYPHDNTAYVHIGWVLMGVDADNSGDYAISLGFVDNIDATDGDFTEIHALARSKQVGNNFFGFFPMSPHGAKCTSGNVATSVKTLNDTALNTATNLRTTLSPATAVTAPNNNDLILRVTVNAGTIAVGLDMAYHTH